MSTTLVKKMTVEEFRDYAATHGRCELIDGEVHEMSPASIRHGIIAGRLFAAIYNFVTPRDLGVVLAAETGFVIDASSPSVRAPDVAYIHKDRVPDLENTSFGPISPDLCAEVLSPTDRIGEINEKIKQWLTFGVRLVWVADPDAHTVAVHEPDGKVRVYQEDEKVNGEDVLPGFELELALLFR